MRYLHGKDKLKSFLESYDEGTPPLLVSNGFPGDFLPLPLTAPLTIGKELPRAEQIKQFRKHKEAKKGRYVTVKEFNRALNGEHDGEHVIPASETGEKSRITLKNQINRLTSTTDKEHPLYNFEEYYWPEITIYLKVSDDFIDTARQLFQYVAKTGYGKRKSIGYGELESMTFEPFKGFEQPEKANGFVSLSNFVPAADDPREGYWRLMVKYGKLGEEWASEDNVFKKPLLMLEAGSTFFDTPCQDFYGCLVRKLSTARPEAVQYAFALPVPMVLSGKSK